ncbi:hypothetical protein LWI29_010892 [Acer saccharum]|uniref:Prolamin-like domain-containing protein n=1 Tax=Acer saccharum TaxID=4024 RepID=A0AA39VBI3_ACESA|nr:hypothetical protein LWI29_010892 [Acer saccharum]KAK1572618.1 hypothetical protein Q3G72_035350 [Acer saccharum]
MTMKRAVAVVVAFLFMVSSVSAWGVGYSYCTCYVNGVLVFGTPTTSPDGSISYCSCSGDQPPPQTPTPIKNPPSPSKKNPPSPSPSPSPHTPGNKNQQPSIIQLPPLPFLNSGAQTCLQEFIDANVCLSQVYEAYYYQNLAYVQPYCCQQFKGLNQDCASTVFNGLNLPYYQNVFNEYCNGRV